MDQKTRGLGDAAGTATAQCAIDIYSNASTAESTQKCAGAAILQSKNVDLVSSVWAQALIGLKDGLAIAGIATVVESVTLYLIANIAGEEAAVVLFEFIEQIIADIMSVISVTVVTTVVGGAAVGSILAGPFAYIGAVIGLVVGAIVGLVEYLDPSHLNITNGNRYSCQDYAGNVQSAATWLSNTVKGGRTTAGITALSFSNQANLFLANPTWLWANQALLAIGQAPGGYVIQDSNGNSVFSQPTPPDQGTYDPIDICYTLLPGAYEMVNQVQFMEACIVVAASPSKLPFYSAVTPGGVADPKLNTGLNPNNTSSLWIQDAAPTWVPNKNYGTGANAGDFVESQADPKLFPPRSMPDTVPTSPVATNTANPIGFWAYFYPPCPNLLTNDRNSSGNQTAVARGIFMLQVIYPCLTVQDCLMIFAANYGPYNDAVNAAKAWADTQCYVTASDLMAGSKFNLDDTDVANILSSYTPQCSSQTIDAIKLVQNWTNTKCPPPTVQQIMKESPLITQADAQKILAAYSNPKCSTPTTTTSTLSKTVTLAAGLSAIGVAWYSVRTGMPVVQASKVLFNKSKTAVSNTAKKVTKKFGRGPKWFHPRRRR